MRRGSAVARPHLLRSLGLRHFLKGNAAEIEWVGTRDAEKLPFMHGTVPATKYSWPRTSTKPRLR